MSRMTYFGLVREQRKWRTEESYPALHSAQFKLEDVSFWIQIGQHSVSMQCKHWSQPSFASLLLHQAIHSEISCVLSWGGKLLADVRVLRVCVCFFNLVRLLFKQISNWSFVRSSESTFLILRRAPSNPLSCMRILFICFSTCKNLGQFQDHEQFFFTHFS